MDESDKRITVEQDVNDTGQPIYRPAEKISEPIKRYWKWIWLVVIALVVVAWLLLFGYFSTHRAPYSAPLGTTVNLLYRR